MASAIGRIDGTGPSRARHAESGDEGPIDRGVRETRRTSPRPSTEGEGARTTGVPSGPLPQGWLQTR